LTIDDKDDGYYDDNGSSDSKSQPWTLILDSNDICRFQSELFAGRGWVLMWVYGLSFEFLWQGYGRG